MFIVKGVLWGEISFDSSLFGCLSCIVAVQYSATMWSLQQTAFARACSWTSSCWIWGSRLWAMCCRIKHGVINIAVHWLSLHTASVIAAMNSHVAVCIRYKINIAQPNNTSWPMDLRWVRLRLCDILQRCCLLNDIYLSFAFQYAFLKMNMYHILDLVIKTIAIRKLKRRRSFIRNRKRKWEFILSFLDQMLLKLLFGILFYLQSWSELIQFWDFMKYWVL